MIFILLGGHATGILEYQRSPVEQKHLAFVEIAVGTGAPVAVIEKKQQHVSCTPLQL